MEDKPDVVIVGDKVKERKRGWVLDALFKIGSLEAAMNHSDEQIAYLKEQLTHVNTQDEILEITEEIANNLDIIKVDYEQRVKVQDHLFDHFNGDRHYYCQLKHRAAEWVVACEVYHSRGCQAEDEESVFLATQALAMTCSLAFGFKPFSCLRCLDNQLQEKDDGN